MDLDETLIHSETIPHGTNGSGDYDFVIELGNNPSYDVTCSIFPEFPLTQCQTQGFGVYVRPYCHEFLSRMSKIFEIGIFTASTKPYCDPVVDSFDFQGIIKHRLYRNHCTRVKSKSIFLTLFQEKYVKDLRTVANWDNRNIIIIDNLVYSFAGDMKNGIPIKPYIKGKTDYELEYIANMLSGVQQDTDVTEYLRDVFKLNRFYKRF